VIAKSLDVVVFLKLLLLDGAKKSYAELSRELGISASEIHAAVRRGINAGLIDEKTRSPRRKPLEEHLIHVVRYAFPAQRGAVVRATRRQRVAPRDFKDGRK
jgi:DNA-binding Lrp family transcriptional regulator